MLYFGVKVIINMTDLEQKIGQIEERNLENNSPGFYGELFTQTSCGYGKKYKKCHGGVGIRKRPLEEPDGRAQT